MLARDAPVVGPNVFTYSTAVLRCHNAAVACQSITSCRYLRYLSIAGVRNSEEVHYVINDRQGSLPPCYVRLFLYCVRFYVKVYVCVTVSVMAQNQVVTVLIFCYSYLNGCCSKTSRELYVRYESLLSCSL